MASAPHSSAPIGVFDSGVGGLTVLHELLVALPHEDFLYVGDSARFPYGDRTGGELRAFSRQIADVLLERGAKLIVVACNSATSAALEDLAAYVAGSGWNVDVIGVVGPESNLAVARTRSGRIGVLATPATVASGAYERAVLAADPLVQLTSVPCPQLARISQDGAPITEADVELARTYCAPLREAGVDTAILGCTHYPFVRALLQRLLGPEVALITSGTAIARRVQHALTARELAAPRAGEGRYSFLCSGDAEAFAEIGSRFLQLPMAAVERVELAALAGSVQAGR
ncbi:MAG TPA: glutamate racemase [Solirubrobacteraceae bacterium]|nr:glutamate racemase [Solirubrobacteraceae bacterium]